MNNNHELKNKVMSERNIQVNPAIKPQIITVGIEQTPIIIIDDFALDTSDIINDACHYAHFKADKASYYPGIRALLPRQYSIIVLQAIYQLICKVYRIPLTRNLVPQDTFYSLITKQEAELDFLQCLPHFDTSKHYHFAILHYLNDNEHGNTGLFRHQQTEFERIEDHRVEEYLTSANDYLQGIECPPKKYVTESTEQYQLYHSITYKPNRLVIYPGNLLHSILINKKKDIDANPATGRLTANIFIEFK